MSSKETKPKTVLKSLKDLGLEKAFKFLKGYGDGYGIINMIASGHTALLTQPFFSNLR